MSEPSYYAPDYATARRRFLHLASTQGAELHALPVDEASRQFINIAYWPGSSDTLLIHTTGLHGVEAFPGSAVQCAFLNNGGVPQRQDHSLVLVHTINPFGMQQLRRTNADNVDLNRNFLEQWATLPENEIYGKIHSTLNPPTRWGQRGFTWRALGLLARYRFAHLQQAIAQGQYTFPQGLFFGGTRRADEVERLLQFFQHHLPSPARIRGIDFHTGLGGYGESSFYLETTVDEATHRCIAHQLDSPVIYAQSNQRQSYQMYGGLTSGLARLYNRADFWMVTQEIGTIGPVNILRALRRENYCYHHDRRRHPMAARQLKAAFCPDDDDWKGVAVREGVSALRRLMQVS